MTPKPKYTDAQIKSLADSLHYCRDATLNDDAEDMLLSILSERQPPQPVQSVSDEDARDAVRWRNTRDNDGKGLRVIQWEPSACEELQVMFPSPVLCDEEADTAIAQEKQS